MPAHRVTCAKLDEGNRAWAHRHFIEAWGSMLVARKGELVDASSYPGFVGLLDDQPAGLLIGRPDDDEYEVLAISVTVEGVGVGRALMEQGIADARRRDCRRLWLTTTNDNIRAIGFYQRVGLTMCALNLGAAAQARALKPSIPKHGQCGIAVEHELDFELLL